jgi:hypothetical protein
MLPEPSREVPSRMSRITIECEGRESVFWDSQATLVELAVCCTHEVFWKYRQFPQYFHRQDGSPSWLIYREVFLGFKFDVECVVRVFCILEGSMLLWDQYSGTQFP